MGALPKKKRTMSRKGKHQSHFALRVAPRSLCPQCQSVKPPHRVCDVCGFYGGREIFSVNPKDGSQEG